MNQQKHKRKESYSLLLVSNTGKDTRQFYLSLKTLRMIIVLMLLVCATFAWNIFRSGTHYRIESPPEADVERTAGQTAGE